MDDFKPGLYRHYKGPHYLALFLVEDSTNRPKYQLVQGGLLAMTGEHDSTQEPCVVYISLDPGPKAGQKDVRTLAQWNAWVDPKTGRDVAPEYEGAVRRFTLVEERQ